MDGIDFLIVPLIQSTNSWAGGVGHVGGLGDVGWDVSASHHDTGPLALVLLGGQR